MNEVGKKNRLSPPQVDHLITKRLIHGGQDTLDDVADERPVAMNPALIVKRDFAVEGNVVRDLVSHHIRPAARSVDGEKAKRGKVLPIDVVVSEAEHFRGALAGRVRGERAVTCVCLDKRRLAGSAIYGRSGSENEVADSVCARGFQQI